jgi:hypothetical protein
MGVPHPVLKGRLKEFVVENAGELLIANYFTDEIMPGP